jgi:subtilisin family serine protease
MAFRFKFRFLFFFVSLSAMAQEPTSGQAKYWIFFKERSISEAYAVSDKTLDNRRNLKLPLHQVTDHGPSNAAVIKLKQAGVAPLQISKWLNAASAYLTPSECLRLQNEPDVASVLPIEGYFLPTNLPEQYIPYALHQMHAQVLFEKNMVGRQVDVGIIDGGFLDASSSELLAPIFLENRVKGFKDFVYPKKQNFFGDQESPLDFHGRVVWEAIAGQNAELTAGLAPKANFYLARTESSLREARVEEDNWVAAIEWLDSLGVRVVNSSLGYATGFSLASENYQPSDMNGRTSIIAKAAQIAVAEKGMIVVVSAGNEGENKKWQGLVSTPGDVEGVISVGANDQSGLKMAYSSVGSSEVSFVKPDVSVFSSNGTSLAAPVVTGLLAAILEKYPHLSAFKCKELIQQAGVLYPFFNNYVGCGFPDIGKMIRQLENERVDLNLGQNITLKAKNRYNMLGCVGHEVLIFHKKNKTVVVEQTKQSLPLQFIERPSKEVRFTTLLCEGQLTEIEWQD